MTAPDALPTGSPEDFDFLAGRWQVSHRRLVKRLAGCCEDWQQFRGSAQGWPLMGGLGNVDDNAIELPEGTYRAVSLRAFDLASRRWSIWGLDGRQPTLIDVPVVGGFEGGIGRFYADEMFEGRPIRVRFVWSGTRTPTPRWEQSFSADGGRSWETNWEMTFSRPN